MSGDRAYKLKKPVCFSFLDFRTLAARRAALEAELRLNRRTAPDLYQAVVPATEADGELNIDGAGEPVEWLLVMARFPEACRLDHVAERGGLDAAVIEALARSITAFHDALEPLADAGGASAMREVVCGNVEDLRRSVPDIFPSDRVEALIAATDKALDGAADQLDYRRRAGLVRHCHGDLHLENIVLLDGGPVLFDCIEFNDAFAQIDLLYDIAFLLMDLLDRGYRVEALAFLQAYTDRVEDDAGLALLPLFLSLRAAVRAKVEAFAGECEPAMGYLDLASRALRPAPPRLIAIGGRSGTGKSSVARHVAPLIGAMPGALLLRSDVIRKRLFGCEPTDRLPEEAYADDVSERVFERLAERAETLLRAGRTVIADGVFGDPAKRERIAQAAEAAAVPFHGFWLKAPQAVLEERVSRRRNDASDSDLAVVRAQGAMAAGPVDWVSIAATDSVERVAERLLARLPAASVA